MPNLISSANFIGDIMLPNVVGTGPAAMQLIDFINRYEPKFLRDIFGVEFYELFVAGLAANDPDFISLRDGGTFVDSSGITREWLGLKEAGSSPIANYIYFKIMGFNVTNTQGVGETVSAVENGTRASSYLKMVNAWNDMVEYNNTLHAYLVANDNLFPEYIGNDYPPSIKWSQFEMSNQYLFRNINIYGI